MVVLEYTDKSSTEPVALESMLVCKRCVDFYEQNLPGCSVAEIIKDKEKDEALAKEIDVCFNEDVEEPDAEVVVASEKNLLSVYTETRSTFAMQESFELWTHTEVVESFQKTPAALRMRAVTLPGKRCKNSVFYFSAESSHNRKLLVTTGVADVGHRRVGQPQLRRRRRLRMKTWR